MGIIVHEWYIARNTSDVDACVYSPTGIIVGWSRIRLRVKEDEVKFRGRRNTADISSNRDARNDRTSRKEPLPAPISVRKDTDGLRQGGDRRWIPKDGISFRNMYGRTGGTLPDPAGICRDNKAHPNKSITPTNLARNNDSGLHHSSRK